MRQICVFQYAHRMDLGLKPLGGITRRVWGTLDAFHLPAIPFSELQEMSHGAAYIE